MANPDSLHKYGSPTINGDPDLQDLIQVETIADYELKRKVQEISDSTSLSEISGIPESTSVILEVQKSSHFPSRPVATRRSYSEADKIRFFRLYDSFINPNISWIASSLMMPPSTARRWVKYRNDRKGSGKPLKSPARPTIKKLMEEHKKFVLDSFTTNPSLEPTDALTALKGSFENLKISETCFDDFVINECGLSFKKARSESIQRDSPANLKLRYDYVMEIRRNGIEYLKHCVFIDESAFKTHTMRRSRGWAPKGVTPVIKTPKIGGQTTTIFGAISSYGLVHISYRFTTPPPSRKRKLDSDTPKQKPVKGTTRRHFMSFLLDLISSLDKSSKFKNCYLVMDNCSIHKGPVIERLITSHGYSVLYLPPYSPELNPIEQFWHLLKSKLKKKNFTEESLVEMIRNESVSIPQSNFNNMVQHSVNQFEKCIRKEPL